MAVETIEDFYKNKFDWMPDNLQQNIGHFNVFEMENHTVPTGKQITYTRRNYYKISLLNNFLLPVLFMKKVLSVFILHTHPIQIIVYSH